VSAANKRRGSAWERDAEEWLNLQGAHAMRLPRAGSRDIGDVAVRLRSGAALVMELKNAAAPKMAQWLREADVECRHYAERYHVDTYPLVVQKTRGKGPGEARVTMTMQQLMDLLIGENLA